MVAGQGEFESTAERGVKTALNVGRAGKGDVWLANVAGKDTDRLGLGRRERLAKVGIFEPSVHSAAADARSLGRFGDTRRGEQSGDSGLLFGAECPVLCHNVPPLARITGAGA